MTDIKYRSLELPGLLKITTSIGGYTSGQLIYTSIASSMATATIRVQFVLEDTVRADQHDQQCVLFLMAAVAPGHEPTHILGGCLK